METNDDHHPTAGGILPTRSFALPHAWLVCIHMRPHRLWQHRCRADACCHAECVGYHHRELIQSGTSCWCPPEVKVSARTSHFSLGCPRCTAHSCCSRGTHACNAAHAKDGAPPSFALSELQQRTWSKLSGVTVSAQAPHCQPTGGIRLHACVRVHQS
jgi:hypothetical protein